LVGVLDPDGLLPEVASSALDSADCCGPPAYDPDDPASGVLDPELLSDTGLVPVCCGVEEGIGEASLAFVARKEPSAIDLPGELGEGLLAGMLTGLEIGLGMVVVVAEFMLDL
jgi:hypothetical protein